MITELQEERLNQLRDAILSAGSWDEARFLQGEAEGLMFLIQTISGMSELYNDEGDI